MKKLFSVLLFALFAANLLHAQTTDALTNTTVIKMVKAKLSDDLIIDEIGSSKVNFDLSDESIKTLTAGNVSDKVIQAMKDANETQNPVPAEIIVPATIAAATVIPLTQSATLAQPADITPAEIHSNQDKIPAQSENIQANDSLELAASDESGLTEEVTAGPAVVIPAEETVVQPVEEPVMPETSVSKALLVEATKTESGTLMLIEMPDLAIYAVSYVIPVTELIPFYNKQFSELADVIHEWDKKLRTSIEKEKQSIDGISKIEKELTDKKNADAKPFNTTIIEQKKNLVLSWEKHKTIKNDMVNEGKILVEELKKISKETESSIETKFKEVSKNVKNADPNPATAGTPKEVIIPEQKFNSKVTEYFTPVTMMLVCYQNEIITIQNTIVAWNELARKRILRDAELKKQLDPLQNELTQYLATTKQNQKLKKKEISGLKKQCDNIEKERKQLAKQMVADSEKLAGDLIKMNAEVQGVVRERYTDIIENIEHSYQDKFNL